MGSRREKYYYVWVMGIAALFGGAFWLADGVYEYYFFHKNLKFLLLEGPESLMDSIVFNVPPRAIVLRISFIIASLIGGLLVIVFLHRQREAQKGLAESEENLRTLVESSTDSILTLDLDRWITSCNSSFLNQFGYSREEVIGQSVLIIHPSRESFDLFGQTVYPVIERKGFWSGEWEFKCKDGSIFPSDIVNSSMKRSDGSLRGYVSILRNITDRKLSEQKIKDYADNLKTMVEERTKDLNRALYDAEQARDRIDGILKSVGDGLIVTDLYNRVILMNRAEEELLGVRLSEVIDRPIDFAIEDKTLRERIKNTLDKKQEGYEFDFELSGKDGENPRIIRARTSIIKDKSGTHTGIITIMHDVTYERELDRMKTEFISTAAHELRTPLTSIQGFSELLTTRDDITEEEEKECLSYINTQSVNLANIINDLLDISRIESGKGFSSTKAPSDMGTIITETVHYFQVQSKRHDFDLSLPEKPVEVMVDTDKMRQVLENILSNAVKYSPEGGEIRITGEVVEDHYQVSIEDQGIGMTSDQIEKMFDKFYRADASNTAIPGTGLGMSIVKYLVEAHGGEVWVASTHGRGTTVKFTIPIT
jgi:PAS domain S-box-containing protein